jgi:hypothetical protein
MTWASSCHISQQPGPPRLLDLAAGILMGHKPLPPSLDDAPDVLDWLYFRFCYTLLVQKVLAEKEWLSRMQPEDFRGLTPLFYGHVNPYRRLVLDMNERIII